MLNFLRRGTIRGEKATAGTTIRTSASNIFRAFIRLLQFVFGIVVIGLYATDLVAARKAGVYTDSKWAYAVAVGTIGAVCAPALYWVPYRFPVFALEYIIFFLYLVAFGIFGKMYIHEEPEGDKGIIRMKHAVWQLLVNMLLWFGTAVYSTFRYIRNRKAKTLHTGAASQHVV